MFRPHFIPSVIEVLPPAYRLLMRAFSAVASELGGKIRLVVKAPVTALPNTAP